MNISENLKQVLVELPAGVRLVAVSKFHPNEAIEEAYSAGQRIFGESKVQEMTTKYESLPKDIEWHFIGHLQKNKVKYLVGKVQLIESVDCLELLETIDKRAKSMGLVQDVLLEVNIGGEESKSGVSPEQLWPLLDAAAAEEHIRVKGLMAIPPVNDDDAQNRRYLAQVYKLFVQAGERGYQNVKMETLSMGMSGDFENAIREGATLVRIGTAIYGERDYSKK